MKIKILLILFLFHSCSPFESGAVRVELKDNKNTSPGASATQTYFFQTTSSSLTSNIAGIERTITLDYSETSSALATNCEITNETNLTVSQICSCDAFGACSVSMQGSTGSLGASSFQYRVGKGLQFSNWSIIDYLQECPTNYIQIPSNADVGSANAFCVMRNEAKNVLGYPSSTTTGQPWTSIDLTSAKAACESLNTLNSVIAKYDLISNPEWMNISRNIEQQTVNWSNGVINAGNELARGHSDDSPSAVLDIGNINDPYDQTLNNSSETPSLGWEQRRTHTLSNGAVIWDFAGNVWEWVDLSLSPGLQTLNPNKKPYSSSDGVPIHGYKELSDINTLIGENGSDIFIPSFWRPLNQTFDHAQGVGQYYGGDNSSGGSLLRGGAYNEGNRSGVYSFAIDQELTGSGNWLGFRCVYRP